MTHELEVEIKAKLVELVQEQSCGEWTDEIVLEDAEFLFNGLWEYFKDDD